MSTTPDAPFTEWPTFFYKWYPVKKQPRHFVAELRVMGTDAFQLLKGSRIDPTLGDEAVLPAYAPLKEAAVKAATYKAINETVVLLDTPIEGTSIAYMSYVCKSEIAKEVSKSWLTEDGVTLYDYNKSHGSPLAIKVKG